MRDICENRHQGNEESKAAIGSISESARTRLKREIADFIGKNGPYGATTEEVSKS